MQDNWSNPVEPNESMTFSLYGLTSYEVQYWNGSSWATVPNGIITNNNKVWKKITFSPVTTSKIRVVTNASIDGYSQITEVEAWGTPAGNGVRWIVSDHLGTPRMIADKTGSLSGISRHDYLPFGEELVAGTGGRTTAQGYSQSDGNRKKWATYERDEETGLDYAQARYYANMQGRFTSPDPFSGSMSLTNPQTFNRYSYVNNNPVVFK